ncbi:MAG: DUF202 domain-containing protein [Clostridia bacterium]|nr:DUF202 domain-containing protein [Clostridia bacterium]
MENYERFRDQMILRDYLARDRTALANERTLLAYIRTFIGFIAAGAGLIKLFDDRLSFVSGTVMICISPLFLILGFIKYHRTRKKLAPLSASR